MSTNRRERLAEVARQSGWTVEYGGTSCQSWLTCRLQPEPNAPLSGPRHIIEIFFDVNAERLTAVYAGVGRAKDHRNGGASAVLKMLRSGSAS